MSLFDHVNEANCSKAQELGDRSMNINGERTAMASICTNDHDIRGLSLQDLNKTGIKYAASAGNGRIKSKG